MNGKTLSQAAFTALSSGHCPDCACSIFRPGPRGGAAQNVECVKCLARFNVVITSKFTGTPLLIHAERIPSEADGGGTWREDMFPKVLQ